MYIILFYLIMLNFNVSSKVYYVFANKYPILFFLRYSIYYFTAENNVIIISGTLNNMIILCYLEHQHNNNITPSSKFEENTQSQQ